MRILLLLAVITLHMTSSAILALENRTPTKTTPIVAGTCFKVIAKRTRGNFFYSPSVLNDVINALTWNLPGRIRRKVMSNFVSVHKPVFRGNRKFWKVNSTVNKHAWVKMGTLFQHLNDSLKNEFRTVMRSIGAYSNVSDIRKQNWIDDVLNEYTDSHASFVAAKFVEKSYTKRKPSLLFVQRAYFADDWAHPFNEEDTEMRPFHLSSVAVKKMPTMRTIGNYRYGELPRVNSKFIEVPYASKLLHYLFFVRQMARNSKRTPVSMFIILPNNINGLSELITNINKVSLDELHSGTKAKIELLLPKFGIESTINIAPCLKELGYGHFLTNSADFRSISRLPLKIDEIFSRTVLNFDERGTQPIAPHEHNTKSSGSRHASFVVDHPFISLIIDENGYLFLTAAIVDPSLEC